jgi:hypothetical protein
MSALTTQSKRIHTWANTPIIREKNARLKAIKMKVIIEQNNARIKSHNIHPFRHQSGSTRNHRCYLEVNTKAFKITPPTHALRIHRE